MKQSTETPALTLVELLSSKTDWMHHLLSGSLDRASYLQSDRLPDLFLIYILDHGNILKINRDVIARSRNFWQFDPEKTKEHPFHLPAYWHFLEQLDGHEVLLDAMRVMISNRINRRGRLIADASLGLEAEQFLLLAFSRYDPETIFNYVSGAREESVVEQLQNARHKDEYRDGVRHQRQIIADLSVRALLGVILGLERADHYAEEMFQLIEHHCLETDGTLLRQQPEPGGSRPAPNALLLCEADWCRTTAIDYWGLVQQRVGTGLWSKWCEKQDDLLETELVEATLAFKAGDVLKHFSRWPDLNQLVFRSLASPRLTGKSGSKMNEDYASATELFYGEHATHRGRSVSKEEAQHPAVVPTTQVRKSAARDTVYYSPHDNVFRLTSGNPVAKESICVDVTEQLLGFLLCFVDRTTHEPLDPPPTAPLICDLIKYGRRRGANVGGRKGVTKIDWLKETKAAERVVQVLAGKIRSTAKAQIGESADAGALIHLLTALKRSGDFENPIRRISFRLEPKP